MRVLGIFQAERFDPDEAGYQVIDGVEERTRTYYSLLLGPIEGSTVNLTEEVVETSTLGLMDWSKVCGEEVSNTLRHGKVGIEHET